MCPLIIDEIEVLSISVTVHLLATILYDKLDDSEEQQRNPKFESRFESKMESSTREEGSCQAVVGNTATLTSPLGNNSKTRSSRSAVMNQPDIPPAFRLIGLDNNSAHSVSSVSSPPVYDHLNKPRSSKLADGYLEKVTASNKKKSSESSQSMKRISTDLAGSSSFLSVIDATSHHSSNAVDNWHTSAKRTSPIAATLSPTLSTSSRSPRTNTPVGCSISGKKKRSSALAAAFLQKVKGPAVVDEEVIHHLKKVPTLAVVKKIKKGRWPPVATTTTRATSVSQNGNSADNSKRAVASVGGADVTSLKDCFENGGVNRNSPSADRYAERRSEQTIRVIGSPVGVRRVRTSFEASSQVSGLPLWMNEVNSIANKGASSRVQLSTGTQEQEGSSCPPVHERGQPARIEAIKVQETPPAAPPTDADGDQSIDMVDNSINISVPSTPPSRRSSSRMTTTEVSSSNGQLTKTTYESTTRNVPNSPGGACPISPLEVESPSISSSSLSEEDDLRPSYKISYTGPRILRAGREWEDGVVDASFPSLPRQNSFNSLEEDHRFDPETSDSNLFLLPNDRRFARERSSVPRPTIPVRKRSDMRFDLDASGVCSLPGLPWIDRRFDGDTSTTDLSLPLCLGAEDEEDHTRFDRFKMNETSCISAPKRPDRSNLTPSVWQTRASEPKAIVGDRKWRLKRIWEDKNNEVVDDSEPEYVVAEPQLTAALNSLLGVPESKIQQTLLMSEENLRDESDDGIPKHWKVKTVWDRDGDVVKIDDEASVDGEELLVFFKLDYHHPNESIVFHYSAETLGLDLDAAKFSVHSHSMGEYSSHTEYIDDDDDDGASFDFEDDSVNMDAENSSSLYPEYERNTDPDFLKQQLDEVEREMNMLILNRDNREDTRQKIVLLQEKLAMYLAQLQDLEHRDEHTEDRNSGEYCDDDDDDDDNLSCHDEVECRDSNLIVKKLRKVERLMRTMIEKKGDRAINRKKYQRLEDKRCQYLDELAREESRSVELDANVPMRASIHSVLDNIDLEVIEEEGSFCSMQQERRDEGLLKKKLEKVEKEMHRLEAENSHKTKSKKLYRKLAEKRSQYLAELKEPLNEFEAENLQESANEAFDFLDGGGDACEEEALVPAETGPCHKTPPKMPNVEKRSGMPSAKETILYQHPPKKKGPNYKYIKLKNYDVCGIWGSPLGKKI